MGGIEPVGRLGGGIVSEAELGVRLGAMRDGAGTVAEVEGGL
jgi:hypothetical protein